MEIRRGILRFQHRHRMRPQMGVQRVPHLVGADRLDEIEVRNLPQSHARPHPCGLHRVTCTGAPSSASRGFLDNLLNRGRIILALPARKGAAVIFQRQFVSRQDPRSPNAAGKISRPDIGGPKRKRIAMKCGPFNGVWNSAVASSENPNLG